MRVLAVTALLLAAGCQKAPPPEDPQIAALRNRMAALEAEVHKPSSVPAIPAAVPKTTVDLVVSWPSDPAGNYQRTYQDPARCEVARQAVFQENARREAESQARVGKNGVVAVGSISMASAVCIPD